MSALSTPINPGASAPDVEKLNDSDRLRKRAKANLLRASTNLKFSDYWFLAGLLLALFYVADPFFWRLDKIGLTKHMPLVISLCGVLLANIGTQVFGEVKAMKKPSWQVVRAGFPLILLAIWIIVGSLYTRKFNDINNTFITVGLYMLFAFLAARVVMISPARNSITRVYLIACAVTSMFMVLRMATNYDGTGFNYHELEALVIPIAVYFALRPSDLTHNDRHYSQLFLVLFFIFAGFVFRKNTGFLVLLFTLFYIWMAEWRFRFKERIAFRYWTILWGIVALLGGIAATVYFAQKQALLPSGNPEYRMVTYEMAWEKFTDSMAWGTSFTGQATEKFTAYTINLAKGNLATHSDVLDLAAQGGILALGLWLWGYLRVGRISLKHALRSARPYDDLTAAAHCLACMSVASIVVYAFNPILLQPAKALLLWSQFGILLGIALHLKTVQNLSTSANKQSPTP